MTVPEALSAPASLEGRVVQVNGYLRPHVLYLFPSRALAEERDWSKALIVGDDPSASIRSSPCPGRFVEMTGVFRQLDPGIYGLTDIRLIRLDDAEICWRADPRP